MRQTMYLAKALDRAAKEVSTLSVASQPVQKAAKKG